MPGYSKFRLPTRAEPTWKGKKLRGVTEWPPSFTSCATTCSLESASQLAVRPQRFDTHVVRHELGRSLFVRSQQNHWHARRIPGNQPGILFRSHVTDNHRAGPTQARQIALPNEWSDVDDSKSVGRDLL